jgi:hypothetical protein
MNKWVKGFLFFARPQPGQAGTKKDLACPGIKITNHNAPVYKKGRGCINHNPKLQIKNKEEVEGR